MPKRAFGLIQFGAAVRTIFAPTGSIVLRSVSSSSAGIMIATVAGPCWFWRSLHCLKCFLRSKCLTYACQDVTYVYR